MTVINELRDDDVRFANPDGMFAANCPGHRIYQPTEVSVSDLVTDLPLICTLGESDFELRGVHGICSGKRVSMTYSEFRFWSIQHDREMVRISMCDAHGAEFFALIPASEGRSYRERRTEALNDIEYAIEMGCQPGMVVRSVAA